MSGAYEDCTFTLFPTESVFQGRVFDGIDFSGSDNPKISYMIQCSLDGTIWGEWWQGLKQQFVLASIKENFNSVINGSNECSEWTILNKIAYVTDIYDEKRKFNVSIEDWEKFIVALTYVKQKKREFQLTIRFFE
jgi:hypothetical protein